MFNFLKVLARVKKRSQKIYSDKFTKNKNGEYVVHISTPSLQSMYTDYSLEGNPVASQEFCSNVENIVFSLPIKSRFEFVINVENDKKTSDLSIEKSKFALAFKHKYLLTSILNEKERRQNTLIALMCLLFGALLIGVLAVIEFVIPQIPDSIWEIIVIAAWVLVWEAFDRLAFRMPEISTEQIRNFYLYHANFRYVKSNGKIKPSNLSINPASIIGTFKKLDDDQKKVQSENKKTSSI